jgi:hypothetical protein
MFNLVKKASESTKLLATKWWGPKKCQPDSEEFGQEEGRLSKVITQINCVE